MYLSLRSITSQHQFDIIEKLTNYFRFPFLRLLNISGSVGVLNPSSLCKLLAGCTNLKELWMNESDPLYFSVFETIAQYCHQVERIEANGSGITTFEGITQQSSLGVHASGLRSVLLNCKKLNHIGIALSFSVSSDDILGMKGYFSSLESINLAFNSHLSEQAISSILENCKSLKVLNLCRVNAVSDVTIAYMSSICLNLQQINLRMCTSVSSIALDNMCEKLLNLSVLHCYTISTRAYDLVRSRGGIVISEWIN
jgi:hypothetical protein